MAVAPQWSEILRSSQVVAGLNGFVEHRVHTEFSSQQVAAPDLLSLVRQGLYVPKSVFDP